MKKILFLVLFVPGILLAGNGTSTKYNPYTGKLDFVGPGKGLLPGDVFYLYKQSGMNAYYTFDGSNLCLFVNDVSKVCYAQAPTEYLLLEDGNYFLLEDGTKLILE